MEIEKMKEKYIRLVKEKALNCNNVYIYGVGKYGKSIYVLLQDNNIHIDGFVVTDSSVNPESVYEKRVIGIDNIQNDVKDTLFIIGVKKRWNKEIINKLVEHGYCNYIESPEYVDLFSDTMNRFERPALEITPKIGCSVNCKFCPQDILCKKYSNLEQSHTLMSFKKYRECLDKTPLNCMIYFAGFVEPFLNCESIEMMKYTAETQRDIALYTTLVGLTNEGFNKIKDIPFFEVVLHVPDKDNYANIPMTDEYFQLLDMVINTKKKNGNPFIDIANCQGEPHPEIINRVHGKITISSELSDRAGLLESNDLFKVSRIEGKIACRRALNVNHFVLLPNGDVVLCCNDFGLQHNIGNLLKQTYDEIYNGKELQQIKKDMISDTKNDIICRKCMYAIQI